MRNKLELLGLIAWIVWTVLMSPRWIKIYFKFRMFLILSETINRLLYVQSMIGRKTLESQIRRVGVFHIDETIRMHPKLDECFKNSECLT